MFHPTAARISQVASDSRASAADLAKAIEKDPLLSARLLKLSNGPRYGGRRQVSNLKDAITVLGFRTTRDLAIAMYIGGKAHNAGPEAQEIWRHSLRVGAGMRLIARYVRGCDASQAMVAGLLHDVGALVMCILDPAYASMAGRFADGSPQVMQAERMIFGVTHDQLGAALLRRWELPECFVLVAGGHHNDHESPMNLVAQLAELMAEGRLDGLAEYAANEATQKLKLTERQLEITLEVLDEEAADIGKL